MSIFPLPATRAKAPTRVRIEVANAVLCVAAGRAAERELWQLLAAKGMSTAELELFANAMREEIT